MTGTTTVYSITRAGDDAPYLVVKDLDVALSLLVDEHLAQGGAGPVMMRVSYGTDQPEMPGAVRVDVLGERKRVTHIICGHEVLL